MSADAIRPDDGAIEGRMQALASILDAHAGGIDLVGIDEEGEVTVRFTGMCTGCPLRPVTLAGLVRPALLDIEGVEAVRAEGARISAEAEARMASQFKTFGSAALLTAINGCGAKTARADDER
jgi:Fe-S cluster biogenesis protein NfuA